MAGYSATPLIRKLGLPREGRAVVVNAPESFAAALGPLPAGLELGTRLSGRPAYVHLFVRSQRELRQWLPKAKRALDRNGMLWLSWPKRSSGVVTDLDENRIREAGLEAGLVDIKICAVDEIWSGLKFVYRHADR